MVRPQVNKDKVGTFDTPVGHHNAVVVAGRSLERHVDHILQCLQAPGCLRCDSTFGAQHQPEHADPHHDRHTHHGRPLCPHPCHPDPHATGLERAARQPL